MAHLRSKKMEILLPFTEAAITDCRQHLSQHPDIDPAVSAYLARYVNGLMCAEIEQVVSGLIRARLERGCSDAATFNFLTSWQRGIVRNARIGEIRDTIGLLGGNYKDTFNNLVNQNVGDEGIDRLGRAVSQRNRNAHDAPPDITFGELEIALTFARKVVEAVRLALEPQT